MNKKLWLTAAAGILASATTLADAPLVAITQIVAHPALDAVHEGVVDELSEQGYTADDNIRYMHESAQGDTAIAAQIAKKFAGEDPAVIVAIATPSAQSVAAAVRGIPVVFTAVTDPVEAKLVDNLDKPGKNITGVTDAIALDKQIAMIQQIVPEAKNIGTVFNPGEANSVATNTKIKAFFEDKGLTLVEAPATKSSEVLAAARSLVGKADAIYITLDNTVVSAMEGVVQVGEQNKLPVFAADTSSVERGAIAALGFDYYDVGRATGKQVADILKGANPGDIPVGHLEELNLFINPGAAAKMGVDLPQEVLDSAAEIVGE
ncbi:ABC transporter substrate-binding protein [Suttonella sp. R2A3]|uniref:ABC transporter substrate-binding protein n=1 Tax=Suttonella sp. R2A3 TaxID=2908648 RepID=UPI001F26518E|nr:ABC transporter substrate-binding protein [Suttonella sp. R2A3]UJF24425.1 ABC transporter substrate-binding protein [Suttonella sp. R2A3]